MDDELGSSIVSWPIQGLRGTQVPCYPGGVTRPLLSSHRTPWPSRGGRTAGGSGLLQPSLVSANPICPDCPPSTHPFSLSTRALGSSVLFFYSLSVSLPACKTHPCMLCTDRATSAPRLSRHLYFRGVSNEHPSSFLCHIHAARLLG